jgi:hypothetical protein
MITASAVSGVPLGDRPVNGPRANPGERLAIENLAELSAASQEAYVAPVAGRNQARPAGSVSRTPQGEKCAAK